MSRLLDVRWPKLLLVPALVILVISLVSGCGDDSSGPSDDSVTVPAAWAGVWDIESTERECDSSTIDFEETYTDTLCAGEELDTDDDLFMLDCGGTATDTKIDVTCTTTIPYEGGTATLTVKIVMNRTGDTMTATARFTVTVNGDVVECTENTLVGTRIAPAPDPCVSSSGVPPVRRMWAHREG